MLEEVDAKANKNQSDIKVLTFGSSGEFREDLIPRSERPFGFDWRFGWQFDRAGFPTPVPQLTAQLTWAETSNTQAKGNKTTP